jgi:serine/threonine-protein kinase
MEFRILGPLEVDAGSGALPLGGPKQRAVLAHLVLRANHVVPAEVLIDGLWGEEPPDAARGTLQAYVSRLRSVLGNDRLEGRPPGYVLHAEPGEVDAERFEALVRDARADVVQDPASAIAAFREALEIWRGPALADLAQETSLAGEISRLDELRLTAVEEEISAELALGQHARLIGQLEALTKEHPLRERLWGDLMLALYRSGRQAEALEAFQRARQVLADELGIDPSRRLQRLHEQILAQDPSLSSPSRPMPVARPATPSDLQPDAELAGYRIEDVLGRGGMSTVYLAEDLRLRRRIALKVLAPELTTQPGFRDRFVRESQIAAGMEHPGIVPIYQAGEADGRLYIAMRYVRGTDLRRLLSERGPLEPERAVRIVRHVAEALDGAHAEGLVHRDVKPGNILLVEGAGAEGRDLVYLSDFGLTKRLDSASGALTKTGQFVGTVDYVAPEQIEGGTVDRRTDQYSLACVLFECLAGAPPHRKDSEVATLYAHLNDAAPKVTGSRPDLPPELDRVLAKALAKEPGRRYATCGELAAAARAAIAPPAAEAPGTPTAVPWHRRPFLAVAGVVTALVVAIVAIALARSQEPSAGTPVATGSPSPTPTPHFATVDRPPTDDEQRLLALLPEDLRATCAPAAETTGSVGDPEDRLGAVACDGGDVEALYSLFASRDAMDAAFGHRVYEAGAYGGDCATDHTAQNPYTVDGEAAGRVLCDRSRDASAVAWTDERLFVLGEAVRDDAGDLSLYEWWLSAGPVVPGTTVTKDGSASVPPLPEGAYLVTVADRKGLAALGSTPGIPQTLGLVLEDGGYRLVSNGPRYPWDDGDLVLTKGPAMVLTSRSYCPGETATYRWETGSDGSSTWSLVGPEGGGRCNPGPWPITDRPWISAPAGQIMYEQYDAIFLLDLEDLTLTSLTASTGQHETNMTPSWSPDGSRIVFASDRDGDFDLYVVNADGTDLRQLTNEEGNEIEPAWSPDGTRIAYHQSGISSDLGPLAVLTLDGDRVVSEGLVPGPDLIVGRPAWSPDGTRIAYRVWTTDRDPDTLIYVIGSDGSGPTLLAEAHLEDSSPAWTPDGERVVFWGVGPGGEQLLSARPDGSDLQPFVPEVTGSSIQIPSWSPDGDWIALGGSHDDAGTLRMMSSDGELVFILGVNASDPEWRPTGA